VWNPPTKKQLAKIPKLYDTEGIEAEEKVIHMHFFIGGCDWYVAEYDPEERVFFGYAILNNDFINSEWGYISLDELIEVKKGFVEVDRDLHFKPKKAGEIEKIKKGMSL
jgi:hypothetical protein